MFDIHHTSTVNQTDMGNETQNVVLQEGDYYHELYADPILLQIHILFYIVIQTLGNLIAYLLIQVRICVCYKRQSFSISIFR